MLNNTATLEIEIEAKDARRAIEAEEMRYDLYGFYSDLFKSCEGIRPRWAYDWSIAELQAAIDDLDPQLETPPTSGDGWSYTGSPLEAL